MKNKGQKKDKKRNRIYYCSVLTGLVLTAFWLMAACGGAKESHVKVGNEVPSGLTDEKEKQVKKEQQEQKKEIEEQKEIIYAILQFDEEEHSVRLQNAQTGKIREYGISDATAFRDKYGNFTDSANMEPGRLVKTGAENAQGNLSYLQIADGGWEQEDVERFSINQEIGMIIVGNTKYSYDANLLVFLDGEQISLDVITENDRLRVAGLDKKVVSVSVTRGHGFLALSNTELFEGGWLSIGNEYVLKIEKDLKVEVPEGTYQVSAANNGYGDTKEVTITGNETTVINLEEYQGAGPKKGKVLFKLDPENAVVSIDGNPVDASQPVELKYGAYQLEVSAENYETWSKKLVVGAAEGELSIHLEKSPGANTTTTTDTKNDNKTSSDNKTTTDTKTDGKTSSDNKTKTDTKTDNKTSSDNKTKTDTKTDSKTSSDNKTKTDTKNDSKTTSDQKDNKNSTTSKDTQTDQDKLLQKLYDFISTLMD